MHFHFRNVNDAFTGLVAEMQECDELNDGATYRTESRNGPVIQFAEPVTITFRRPTERVLFNEARDANPFFHVFESMWMLAGRNDIKPLTDIVKKYADFSDDRKTANGAYGYRWRCVDRYEYDGPDTLYLAENVDQLNIIATHLRSNPTSRRAVLQMWNVEDDLLKIGGIYKCDTCSGSGKHQNGRGREFEGADCLVCAGRGATGHASKDVCCNTSVMFSLRDRGEAWPSMEGGARYVLDMTVTNRSNDLVWGLLGANVVHFSFLQEYMASRIGAEVGVYHHFTNNLHAYEWNWKPEKWLKEGRNRNMHSPASPYDRKDFRHVPLTADEDFEREVKRFVESPVMANVTGDFLNNVAYPMMSTHSLYKQERYEEAVRETDEIKALDWRIAALGWLKRRIEKKLQKGGVA